jgi:hypothetical protein
MKSVMPVIPAVWARCTRPYGWDDCDFDDSEPDWMALFRIFFLDNFPSRVITFQVVF